MAKTLRIVTVALLGLGAYAGIAAQSARAEIIFGLTAEVTPRLVSVDSAAPGTNLTSVNITGFNVGHVMRSIDFRPLTGELWGLSQSTSDLTATQLYRINTATGVATPVGTGVTLAGNTSQRVQIDFNPAADRIRITTSGLTNNNYRANPLTGGLVQQDTNFAFASGDPQFNAATVVVAAAYNNNVANASSTTLFAWNLGDVNDTIVRIGSVGGSPDSPNNGVLNTLTTPLPGFVANSGIIGFDVSGVTGLAYVSRDNASPLDPASSLYIVSLAAGPITPYSSRIGAFAQQMFDISVTPAPIPEPTTLALCGFGMIGVAYRSWRKRKSPA